MQNKTIPTFGKFNYFLIYMAKMVRKKTAKTKGSKVDANGQQSIEPRGLPEQIQRSGFVRMYQGSDQTNKQINK